MAHTHYRLSEGPDSDEWVLFQRRLREQDPEWLHEDKLKEIEGENGWFPEILFLPNAERSAGIAAKAWSELD